MIIDPSKFEHVYRQLLFITRSRYPDTEPSFTSGFWDAEEGYKRDFWEKARTSLELDSDG